MAMTGTVQVAFGRGGLFGAVLLGALLAAGCQAGGPGVSDEHVKEEAMNDTVGMIVVEVGGREFPARLEDNATARSLVGRLPISIDMEDLNAREKFRLFPDEFPGAGDVAPPTIRSGEILCWSSNTLVLFYRTFANTYGGYDRIGAIQDTAGLAQALGKGSIKVTFRSR